MIVVNRLGVEVFVVMNFANSLHSGHCLELIYVIRDDDWAPDFLERFDFSLACCLHALQEASLVGEVLVTVVDLASETKWWDTKVVNAPKIGGYQVITMSQDQLYEYSGSSDFNVAIGNNIAIRRSRSKFCVLQASDCFYTPFQLKKLVRFFRSDESSQDEYYLVPRVFLPNQMPLLKLGPELSCAIIDEWPAEQSVPAARKFNLGGGYGSMAASVDLWFELGGLDEYPQFIGVDGDFFARASIANPVVNLYDYGIKMFKFPRRQVKEDTVRLKSKEINTWYRHSYDRYSGNAPGWGAASLEIEAKMFPYSSPGENSKSQREVRSYELEFPKVGRVKFISLTRFSRLRFDWFIKSLIDISTPSFFIVDEQGAQLVLSTVKSYDWLNGLFCQEQSQCVNLYNSVLSGADSFILSLLDCRSRVFKCNLSNLSSLLEGEGWRTKPELMRPMIFFPNLSLEKIQAVLPISLYQCCIIVAAGCARSQFVVSDKCFSKVVQFDNINYSRPVSVWADVPEAEVIDLLNREARIKWFLVYLAEIKLIRLGTKWFKKIWSKFT